MYNFDKTFQKLPTILVAGIDEAGRGPLAGPVVCASVIMPLDEDDIIERVNDSKKLSEKLRNELYAKIIEKAIDYSVVFVSESEIDEINILNATKKGMQNTISNLNVTPDIVLVDAVQLQSDIKTVSIVRGDATSYHIACASILAKVERDNYMKKLAQKYPNYGFEKHKGYGTKLHMQNIRDFGPCDAHRRTFIKKIT